MWETSKTFPANEISSPLIIPPMMSHDVIGDVIGDVIDDVIGGVTDDVIDDIIHW